ncbi:alpha/beta hydrolase [Mycobacterium gordonae]|uniref:alpha/beta fold hydrolase n=1 Tax=Mycobacterium gordonae TaxID=1778 RepID=UPI00210D0E48|nr:alpha/beta hydrolase [Mycobacterium gordonae]MCQ4361168.1 alpha/beta hydrolase [Mycobacterium gordonae]
MQLQTRQIVVDGVASPVLIGGVGATTEAVVFVHGNPGAGGDWESLMNLVGEFATVVAPDMPGFGGADRRADRDYTVSAHAAHLGAVIDQLGISTVHLVAHDFGGPFALAWAAANHDKVASVTLINTGLLLDYKWHRLARVWRTPVAGELLMRSTTRNVGRLLVRHDNPGLPGKWANRIVEHLLPDATKRAVLRLYRSTSAADMDALIEPLRRCDPDVLVVFGAADVYIPVEQAERQRRVFPGARIEILPGVGHWAWLEQPDRVAGLVVPFLRERVGANVQKINQTKELR